MPNTKAPNERIPRRPLPEFHQSEASVISSVMEDGFFRVALDDVNQYGPHAMIMLLFVVATVTAIAISIASLLYGLF